ncbi:hypothetical protein Nepgr_020614 [Nepenthes gracilis]|uniref:RRM domain-containing protein n=1 Tax=Nepenthes gracilis TaxID=150966 RepID=A0AAD3SWH8_NEPGR|nr:hypothetical protein Nepgr_020614 [Nepenthes gracilis]
MAAAAATASIGSSFSTAIQTIKCAHTKHRASDLMPLKFGPLKTLQPQLISHTYGTKSPSIGTLSNRRQAIRVAGAVAQEETTAGAEAVQEEKEAEEVVVEEEVVAEGQVNTKLYFGNLPYHCDSAQLAGILQEYATPELVEVLYDRETGKSRGFAFVTMSSIEDCHNVIKNLDGSEYGGRFLRVNFSDKPRSKEPLYPETDHKLFVGNLSWSVTSESLRRAFEGYGNVVGARVLYDGETGRSRGYGFVCFSMRSEMENALSSVNGVELEGREIRVSIAQGKRL